MLAKSWKKIGMLILIIACIFNVMNKLINKLSLNTELIDSAEYMQVIEAENKIQNQETINNTINEENN